MVCARSDIVVILKSILSQSNSESEFAHWFLPLRINMLRFGLCVLGVIFIVLGVIGAEFLSEFKVIVLAYCTAIALCIVLSLGVRALTAKYNFDVIISSVVFLITSILFSAFIYVGDYFNLYAITACAIVLWIGALSGLNLLATFVLVSTIVLSFAFSFESWGNTEYLMLVAGVFFGLISLFFCYFKESHLRELFVSDLKGHINKTNKSKVVTPLKMAGNERPSAAWSQTLKELSVRLLSINKTDQMFDQLMVHIAKAIQCDACAACLSKNDVLSIMTVQGSIASSPSLEFKDVWPYELIDDLKSSKKAALNLAPFGLLESSVKEEQLVSDYRLDIPVFSKNKLSAVITLLRKGSEFLDAEVQLASSMVFHAMIALRLAKFQASVQPSCKVNKKDHLLISKNEGLILYERKEFISLAKKDFSYARRNKQSLSLLLVEIDDFLGIETRLGSNVAQNIFLTVAEIANAHNRQNGLIGFYDNGVFAMQILVDLPGAEKYAENLRVKIAQRFFRIDHHKLDVTISIGVTTSTEASLDYMSMLRCADMGLFLAKDEKGNVVRVSI